MSKLSKDYSRIMIWDKNLKLLLNQVEEIVVSLFQKKHLRVFLQLVSKMFNVYRTSCTLIQRWRKYYSLHSSVAKVT